MEAAAVRGGTAVAVGRAGTGASVAGRGAPTAARGVSAGAALTEARLVSLARSGGLAPVLDELVAARAVIDGAGRVMVGRTATVVVDQAGVIRLAASRDVLGRVTNGRIIATRSVAGAGAEIGEFHVAGTSLAPGAVVDVTIARPGWYRVTLRPAASSGAPAAALLVAGAVDAEAETSRGSDVRELIRAADEAGERRRLSPRQRVSSSSQSEVTREIAALRSRIDRFTEDH